MSMKAFSLKIVSLEVQYLLWIDRSTSILYSEITFRRDQMPTKYQTYLPSNFKSGSTRRKENHAVFRFYSFFAHLGPVVCAKYWVRHYRYMNNTSSV